MATIPVFGIPKTYPAGGSSVLWPDGTASAPGAAFASDSTKGIFSGGSNIVSLSIGGVQKLNLNANAIYGQTGGSAYIFVDRAASATVATLIPNQADNNTGVGHAAADTPAIVGGGIPLAVYGTTVEISNAEIKALRATPITLVAAQGANTIIEFVSAMIILDYGSDVLTESTDNMVIQYSGGTDTSGAIEATGFIDSAADDTIYVVNSLTTDQDMTALVNDSIELFNTGNGEYGGNATADTTMTVKITYRVHATGL